jgi:alpha-tubulin suppressor-like RCC1 family protein
VRGTLSSASAVVMLVGCAVSSTPRTNTATVTPAPVNAPPMAIEPDRGADPNVERFELALDDHHVCVRMDGAVHCGKGKEPLLREPVLGGITDAISVSTRSGVTCLVTRKGTVHCAGSNVHGELGARLRADESKELVHVVGIEDATRVIVGDGHVCAQRRQGKVSCWGRNESGQTGGDTYYRPEARELVVPTPIPSLENVASVAAGDNRSCAVTTRGETWCWGEAITKEQERAHGRTSEEPFKLTALSGLQEVTANGFGICGTKDGAAYCWGARWNGTSDLKEPVAVLNVRRVRAGRSHACALTHDGAVHCWGSNMDGELGRAEARDENKSWEPMPPARVPNLGRAIDIAAGGSMSCAIVAPGEAMCWGGWPYNEHGRPREHKPVKLAL